MANIEVTGYRVRRVVPMSDTFARVAAAAAAEWRAARAAEETEHEEGCALWRAAWDAGRFPADPAREASALAALASSDEARGAASAAADEAWRALVALVGDGAVAAWVRP